MPPITTNRTSCRFRTATIPPGSNTRRSVGGPAAKAAGDTLTFAFVERVEFLGREKAFCNRAGRIVPIRLCQAHANLETGCVKDPTQRVN
jgi:hypothetical protein